MTRFFKSAAFPILIVVVLAFFAKKLIGSTTKSATPTFGEPAYDINHNDVQSMTLDQKDNSVSVTLRNGNKFSTGYPDSYTNQLINDAINTDGGTSVVVQDKSTNGWLSLLTYILPFVIFIGFWIFLMNQVQGGGSKVMSFGKSRAKRMSVDSPKITFRDVAGVEEAVEELHEIKEFLREPQEIPSARRSHTQGRAVRTAFLPGTGKTLLGARGRR